MKVTTAAKLVRDNLYAFVYGAEGSGKTCLSLSLRKKENGSDIAFITAEEGGPTSAAATMGCGEAKVAVLSSMGAGVDPIEEAFEALKAFGNDKTVSTICIDGCTAIAYRAVDYLSEGKGEKALGYEGWGQILNALRHLEGLAEKITRQGKSVIYTAWERPPDYETQMTLGGSGRIMTRKGGAFIPGRGQIWLPGNCDVYARMTSTFKKVRTPDGKTKSEFKGLLHFHQTEEWLGKCRWDLMSPYPANLSQMLKDVRHQATVLGAKTSAKEARS